MGELGHLVMQRRLLLQALLSVMVGSLFGGTDESPGKTLVKNGKKFKMYRGMASFYASLGRKFREEGPEIVDSDDLNDYVAEGVEAMVPYKGSVVEIIRQLVGGLRSGLSYCGVKDDIGYAE